MPHPHFESAAAIVRYAHGAVEAVILEHSGQRIRVAVKDSGNAAEVTLFDVVRGELRDLAPALTDIPA